MEIMSDQNPNWHDFINRLCARFPTVDSCDHTHNNARAVMEEMGGINVEQSISAFNDKGGHCDCEVLCNLVNWEGVEQ